MSNLATMHLKCLLEQATPGPWTVEDDGYDIIVGNAEGHRMGWGDQVRFKFEAGDKKHDTALAALAPELAQEVIRLRGEIKGLIAAMEVKAATGESQSPAVIAGHLKEKVLGETND